MNDTTKERYSIKPFVKWAGGKRQLLTKLKDSMPSIYNALYEPFVGGGALTLDVQPDHAVINDKNEQLINAYHQLKVNTELVINLIREIDKAPCDTAKFSTMRDVYNKKIVDHTLDAECAALFVWLNQHCFNGLYRVNSAGLFNVSYNKGGDVKIDEDNLRNIGAYLNENDITICHNDFESVCAAVSPGDFVYFDSPYLPASETANFTTYTKDGFSLEDHKRLAELYKTLSNKGVYVMASNNDVPLVRDLYRGFFITNVDVRRAINCKADNRVGKEVIICNY